MVLEFTDVPAALACIEFPAGWVGTTTPVRVSTADRRVTICLARAPLSGRAAHGIFQPSERIALVVDRGTGHLFKETHDGALWVAPLRMHSISDVLECPSCIAIVSEYELEVLLGDALLAVPTETADGFRGLMLTAQAISGQAWRSGEWRDFSFELSSLGAVEIAWQQPGKN